jgi:hypothetical protein
MQKLSVTNSQSYDNDGQAFKIGSALNVTFQNNVVMENCRRIAFTFGDEPGSAIVPNVALCRPSGTGEWVPISINENGTYLFQGNTFAGYGATSFDLSCDGGWDFCNHSNTVFENNLWVGIENASVTSQLPLPGLFYASTAGLPPNSGWAKRDHNLYYNAKNGCPTLLTGEICANPALPFPLTITNEHQLDTSSSSYVTLFMPSSTSPALKKGVAIPGLTTDINGVTRPNPPSIGAVER